MLHVKMCMSLHLVNIKWMVRVGVITEKATLFSVKTPLPICHYNEDCPPHKLCDRLNRVCINPCLEDYCGDNAQCLVENHVIDCHCLDGYLGNPYVECIKGTLAH